MLTRTYNDLPFEYLAPGKFEELCLALVRRDVDPDAQHLGAAGSDEGYDVRATVDGKVVCYQCKRYQTFQLSHAKKAIDAAFAGKEPPDEMVFVLPRVVRLELRRQIEDTTCPVPCSFWARTELQDRLWEHADLVERFFGNIRSRTPAPHWTIPRRNPYFTGRAEVIQDLRDALLADGRATLGQTRAVVGLGGVGKTQTAIEYANAFHLNYSAAFWIKAETESSLRSSVTEMARIFELPEAEAVEEDVVVQAVLNHLASTEGWLLVYDNVESPELLDRFQPPKLTGHVLITSRLKSLAQHQYRLLELATFGEDEALAFLLDRTERELESNSGEYRAAGELVEVLGRLPLALEQAAAYISSLKTSFVKYLDAYRSEGVLLLDAVQAKGHPESVTKTWAMNLQQVEQESRLAVRLLQILAYLAPDDVPEVLFRDGEGLESDLADELASSPLALDRLLEPLQRFSLIERDRATGSVSTHRLVQEMTRLTMPDDLQQMALQAALAQVDKSFPDPEVLETWTECGGLLAHVQCLQKFTKENLQDSLKGARLFNQTAIYCWRRGLYAEAEILFLRALSIRKKIQKAGSQDIAHTQNCLAVLYSDQGLYEASEDLYVKSIRSLEAVSGRRSVMVASALSNLGLLYIDLGRFEESEAALLRSLSIFFEDMDGRPSANYALTANNLAYLYLSQGRFREAEVLAVRALDFRRTLLGDTHPDVAQSLHNIANLYVAQGRLEEAEPLLSKVLNFFEMNFDENHPSIAHVLNDWANLCMAQGRYEEAESLYRRDLSITTSVFGARHPGLAITLNNLASLSKLQRRFDTAESFAFDALRILESALEGAHPEKAKSLMNLADILSHQERFEEAEPLFLQAISIYEEVFGSDHPDLASTRHCLAKMYLFQGRYSEAESLYLKALYAYESVFEEDHPNTAATLAGLAESFCMQGDFERAEELIARAFNMYKSCLGEPHSNTEWAFEIYLDVLKELNRHDEVDQLRADFDKALAETEAAERS